MNISLSNNKRKISIKSGYHEFTRNFLGYSLNLGCGSDPTGNVRMDFAGEGTCANIVGNVEMTLPFKDNTFDLVIAHGVIEHLKNPYSFLDEVRRVLKPSGTLSLVTDNASFFYIYFPGQRHGAGYVGLSPLDKHRVVFHDTHVFEFLSAFGFLNIDIELCAYKDNLRKGKLTKMLEFLGYYVVNPLLGESFAQYFIPIIWARATKSLPLDKVVDSEGH